MEHNATDKGDVSEVGAGIPCIAGNNGVLSNSMNRFSCGELSKIANGDSTAFVGCDALGKNMKGLGVSQLVVVSKEEQILPCR